MCIPECRVCGGKPRIASLEIVPGHLSYAYHCENLCGNDTHWQFSMHRAEEMWRDNPCKGCLGGQGDPRDDLRRMQ